MKIRNGVRCIIAVSFFISAVFPGYSRAATTAVVTVTAHVMAGQNSISVDTNLVDFGGVSGSVTNKRFIAGPVVVNYFPGSNPWTIRVYTMNPGDIAGLIGVADSNESIPLKVWCDNYGPMANILGHAPDEENQYFWKGYDLNGVNGIETTPITSGPDISETALGFDVNGDGDMTDIITPSPTGISNNQYPVPEEPVWLRIPDDSEMIPGNPFSWRRLTYSGAELNSDGFPVYFAIDVTGVVPQDYRTTTLTFQIINE